MASYDSTQPQDDEVKTSRLKLVANSGAIETYIARDHVSFDDNTDNSGLHKTVTMISQGNGSVPDAHPTTIADQPKLYGYKTEATSKVDAYFREGSNGMILQAFPIKAWGVLNTLSDDGVTAGNNIASFETDPDSSVRKRVTFTTAMPNVNYMVIFEPNSTSTISVTKTVDYFSIGQTGSTSKTKYNLIVVGN